MLWRLRPPRRSDGTVQAVLFDLDGTLVDSNGFHVEAWQAAFAERGIDLPAERIAGQIGKGGDLLVPSLAPDLAKAEQAEIADRHGAIFQQRHLDHVRAFPGAAALLRQVAASGRKVALASSASKKELDHYIALLDGGDVVDVTTSIEDAATSKPAGDIFAAALAKLRVQPVSALAVGDTPYDIEAGKRSGIATIAVRSGGFPETELTAAGAIAIYDDVQALLADPKAWSSAASNR